MGLVYLAENRLMGRHEVLKLMGRQIMERPGVLERFLREIRAVAKLRHPNIVTAYHAAPTRRQYRPRDGVRRRAGPGPDHQGSRAATRVERLRLHLPGGAGLAAPHEHAMVHRDIKPSNLMLTRQGDRDVIKVLDFGLAKSQSERPTDWTLTHEGQLLGTPDFIAPEQIRDARQADIRPTSTASAVPSITS